IPVKYLVNGISIIPADLETVEYFHLQFERHEVMFANDVAVESYQRSGDHDGFANGADFKALDGSDAIPMSAYAPVLGYHGGRQHVGALARMTVSHLVDIRDPIQIAYDRIATRARKSGMCETTLTQAA